MISLRTAALLLLLWALPALAPAADSWGPWESPPGTGSRRAPSPAEETTGLSLLSFGVRFFQTFISPVDGPRCSMTPTCSAYALQALEKHGPLLGTFLTVDRLYHESDPAARRRPRQMGNRIRFHDPVENNDFWFARE